jgi:hypothetical protein
VTSPRHAWRVALGGAMLLLSILCLALVREVSAAQRSFADGQAAWQRAVAPEVVSSPGIRRRVGETLLGVRSRADVQRAYSRYRAGLADVIEGTSYPQTTARFTAVEELSALRDELPPADRAVVETVIGAILVDGAKAAGPRKRAELRRAEDAFRRALAADPGNAIAKLDLEVLLQRSSSDERRRSRAPSPSGRSTKGQVDPKGPVASVRAEGEGF